MKICVLASGSSGNCIFVSSGSTRILVDAGLSGRETGRRLNEIGEHAENIDAICLTHEHADHVAGLRVLSARFGMNLYANAGTIEALGRYPELEGLKWTMFTTGYPFRIGDLTVEPFSVPHDAYEPVGFVISHEGMRAAIVTDIGVGTHLVRERLRGCQVLVLESNHDESMLANALRPWHLKQRIAGRQGHISNQCAAAIISEIAGPDLLCVFLAHISLDCNRPDLAMNAARGALKALNCEHVKVELTNADKVSEIWCLHDLKKRGPMNNQHTPASRAPSLEHQYRPHA